MYGVASHDVFRFNGCQHGIYPAKRTPALALYGCGVQADVVGKPPWTGKVVLLLFTSCEQHYGEEKENYSFHIHLQRY